MAESALQQLESRLAAVGTRRHDGYYNQTTGIGDVLRDKRQGGFATARRIDYQECADLYRGNWLAARIVDALPNDCVRKGWTLAIEGDKGRKISEAADATLRDLEAKKHLRQAHRWSRAFGGAGVFVGVDDGQTADQPVNFESIKSVDWLLPVDTLELVPASYYSQLGPNYGKPQTYILNRFGVAAPLPTFLGGSAMVGSGPVVGGLGALAQDPQNWNYLPIVHESRIIRFEGVFINRLTLRSNRYWGDSIFNRIDEVLRDYGLSWASASILLQDFAQAVHKLPGFAELLAKIGPAAYVQAAAAVEVSRSTARALFIDKEDEFERKATPMTGLPELLVQFALQVAGAADMPVSRLFGQAPAGLNATGDADAAWWADKVAAEQEDALQPALRRLLKIVFAAKAGPTSGKNPGGEKGNWHVHFAPLKQLDDLQQADRRLKIAQADEIYMRNQAVTPEEVAVTRFAGDDYNGDKLQLVEENPEKRALMAQEQAEAQAGEGSGEGSGEGTGAADDDDEGGGTGS